MKQGIGDSKLEERSFKYKILRTDSLQPNTDY